MEAKPNKFEDSIKVNGRVPLIMTLKRGVEHGTPCTVIPLAKSPLEAFERMIKIDAQTHFEYLQNEYKRKYGYPQARKLSDELVKLEQFITEAEKGTTDQSDATNSIGFTIYKDDKNEYLRLNYGFYKDHYCNIEYSEADLIYGKYFLYRDWLKNEIDKLNNIIIENPQSPVHLIELHFLSVIHAKFNDDLWDNINVISFCSLFDIHNRDKIELNVKFNGAFYVLLHRMFHASKLNLNRKGYLKPLLESINLNFEVFESTVGQKTELRQSKRLNRYRREIDNFMQLNAIQPIE